MFGAQASTRGGRHVDCVRTAINKAVGRVAVKLENAAQNDA